MNNGHQMGLKQLRTSQTSAVRLMAQTQLYSAHIDLLTKRYEAILEQTKFDGITISSGEKDYYFLDDQQIPFRPNPHFLQWVPLFSENHLLTVSPGQSVLLRIFQPSSYWNDPISLPDLPESERVEIKFFDDLEELWSDVKESKIMHLSGLLHGKLAFVNLKLTPKTSLAP